MERIIFHVDVNSAYLSWEAARQVAQGKPDLRSIPSAIGGDREKRTGVILAKSIPAKKFGVKTGEPVAWALKKCPELVLAQPDFVLYEKSSAAFMDICRQYTPVVEKYSIDECFLDMTGTQLLYPDLPVTAAEIKNKIYNQLGFTVNIGIGPNKLLAKMASDFEKPNKVHTLFLDEIKEKLWPLPVDNLFSVGNSTAQKLKKAYIKTIGDLANTDLTRVQFLVGVKLGKQIHDYANGIDDAPVLSAPEEVKGYSNSTTLSSDITSVEEANNILLSLCDSVASRMRADAVKAYSISVMIRSNRFQDHSHQCKLQMPTDITSEIYDLAKQLFLELWDGHTPLRLLGVSLTNITHEDSSQLSLFQTGGKERQRKVDLAIDKIRSKFGSDTILHAASLHSSSEVGRKHKAQLDKKIEK